MKSFIKAKRSLGRTVLKEDCILFAELVGIDLEGKNAEKVDSRLTLMIAVGLLNRTFNLEEDLAAVIGQDWSFHKQMEIGQTLYVKYGLFRKEKTEKPIYIVEVSLHTEDGVIGEGHWTLLLNREIEVEVNV